MKLQQEKKDRVANSDKVACLPEALAPVQT